MKLLFDTHAFIWGDGDQTKLPDGMLAACRSPGNSLHLSLVSIWELQIKMQLRKLTLRLTLAEILGGPATKEWTPDRADNPGGYSQPWRLAGLPSRSV